MKHKLQTMLKHKLQWLMLLAALLGVNQSAWGWDTQTVYCAISSSTLGSYTLKLNACVGDSHWETKNMDYQYTYKGKKVYKADFENRYGGVDVLQFQLYNGGSYVGQRQPYGSWTTYGTYKDKLYDYDNQSWSSSWWADPTRALFDVKVYISSDKFYYCDKWHTDASFSCNNFPGGTYTGGYNSDTNLGTLSDGTTFYIKGRVWCNNQNQNYSAGVMYYKIDDGSESQKSISKQDNYNGWCEGHYWDRYDSNELSLTNSGLSAGVHKLKIKFKAPWNETIYEPSSSTYYEAKFTVPGISVQPSSTGQSVCKDASATALSVTAVGSSPTYQWQSASESGGTYSDISGAYSSSYTPPTGTVGTKYYRCKVTISGTTYTSDPSGAIVVKDLPTLTGIDGPTQLVVSTTSAGTYTTQSITGATYHWSSDIIGIKLSNGNALSTATGNSIEVKTGSTTQSGKYIRVYATKDGCNGSAVNKTEISVVSSCTAPTSASDITAISPSSEQTITLSGGDAPSVTQSVTATCAKGDTYLWSASPNNITYKIGDASYSTTRADFTNGTGTTKSATMNMYFEGEYTANFAVGCSNTSGANKNTSTIKVYPGTIYLNGPFFNGNDFNGSEYEAAGTNHNIEIVDSDNDHIFTYEWIATYTSGKFTIKTTARGGDATHILANYANLSLTGISKDSNGNHNLSPNIGTITAGDRLRLTIEYTGVDGSGVPEYDIKLKKIPVPTTDAAEDIGLISAKLKGSHPTGDVYEAITAKGFYYGTTSSPSTPVDNKTAAAGSIVRTLNSLNPGITYYYKAYVVSGGVEYCGSVLSFTTTECSAPSSVTSTQMAAANYCKDAAATALEVTGSGGVTPYSYQWYSNTTAGTSGGSSISGANSETYTPPTSTAGNKYYYCVVKSASPCASSTRTSDVSGLIHVDAPSATGTIQNGGSICGSGENNRSRTLSLSGASATQYQWYSSESENTGYSAINNATNSTYVASPSEATYYKVEVKNGVCGWTTGLSVTPAQVTVDVPSVAGSIQGAGAVCDSKGNLSISGETGTSYQWQRSSDGSSFSNISGAISATYNATGEVSSGPRYYKVKVTNGACDAATSDAVRVTQGNIVTITVEPDETYITTSPYLYAWYKSGNNNIETLGNWHGTSMGALQDGVYKYTFDTKTCGDYYIIINNNDKKQTSDIHITDTGNKCFHLTGDWGNNYETCCESTSSTSVSVDESSICKGVNVTVSVTDAQDGYTYQLYTSSTAETPIETEDCTSSGSISFDAVAPDATTTYYVKAYQTGTSCTPENVGNAAVTVIDPTITIIGIGAKSENATYPWEYITLTATTNCSTVTWDDAVFVGGSAPAYSENKNAKTYMLKSAITARPDDDYYLIGVSGTYGGCAAEAEYKIYINQAPAEPSCN